MKNKKYINYIKLLIITVVTVSLTLGICSIYTKIKRSDKSPLAMNLQGLNYGELSSYVVENPEFVLYMSASKDKSREDLEKQIYDYALKYGFLKQFIYLDNTEMTKEDYAKMRNDYFNINLKDIKLEKMDKPYVMKFTSSKVEAILLIDESIGINEIRTFIGKND